MKYKTFLAITCCLFCIVLTTFAARPRRSLQFQINGVNKEIQTNINRNLSNAKNELKQPLTQAKINRLYNQSPKLIKQAIAPFGYLHPRINKTLTRTKRGWLVQYHITKGIPIRVSQIKVIIHGPGKNQKLIKTLQSNLPIKAGDILQTEKYEDIKTSLFSTATHLGYFKATMPKNVIFINVKTHKSKIIIEFNTGKRFRFGKTIFSKTSFHQNFLRRYLTYKKGEFYHADKLEQTQRDLIDSNHFAQVLVTPDPQHIKNGQVPIHIVLTARKAKLYTLGIGYGTDTLFRATLGVTLRQVGNWGQRFKVLMRASENNSSIIANYLIPGSNPAKDLFTISGGFTNIDLAGDSSGKSSSFSVNYNRKSGRWNNGLSLTYLNERYSIKGIPNINTQLVYPTLQTHYLYADHKMNPTRGFNFYMQLSGSKHAILSHTDFSQISTEIKTLYTIKQTHTRLLFRNKLGFTNIKNLNELPLSLQLLAGGAKSVRGFSYNFLGPGRNLIIGSVEIQQRVYDNWYIAAFVDAALVGSKDTFDKVHMGVGPGLVWLTPVGAIELTLANAVTENKKPWMVQFTMGSVLL